MSTVLLLFHRKTLLLATGIIVAGGSAAAYMQSRKSLTNQSSIDQYDGPIGDVELNTSVGMSENNVKKSRQKKGGLRSLKVLAAILLSRMSSLGTRDLLALIVTVVSFFTSTQAMYWNSLDMHRIIVILLNLNKIGIRNSIKEHLVAMLMEVSFTFFE